MTARARAGCPLCGEPVHAGHAPFCSRGCKDRDLLNWLGEGYRLPDSGDASLPGAGDEDDVR